MELYHKAKHIISCKLTALVGYYFMNEIVVTKVAKENIIKKAANLSHVITPTKLFPKFSKTFRA